MVTSRHFKYQTYSRKWNCDSDNRVRRGTAPLGLKGAKTYRCYQSTCTKHTCKGGNLVFMSLSLARERLEKLVLEPKEGRVGE